MCIFEVRQYMSLFLDIYKADTLVVLGRACTAASFLTSFSVFLSEVWSAASETQHQLDWGQVNDMASYYYSSVLS